jgi:D-glycero-beta-D-manno-heptose 1-phosphate adenylyltransferase
MHSGVYTLTELQQAIATAPNHWRPLVFTNGCFDLLHAGHVRYLWAAKGLGKSLVVGLNSDRSVQAIKPGKVPPRPIVPETERAEILAALKPVDAVVIFDQPTASVAIAALKPDIYVKGGDYEIDQIPEAATVQAYGGKIELITIQVPSSTTGMIKRIRHA